MSSINDFLDMMPHTVYISRKTGVNDYNAPTFGSRVSYRARIKYGTKLVRSSRGEVVPVSGEMWLATTDFLNEDDQYEFERDTTVSPNSYEILMPVRIDTLPDEDGFHHIKIYFN